MKKAFDLLAELPEDIFADGRQDTRPQEPEDPKIEQSKTSVARRHCEDRNGKSDEEN
jgi:hypothetical protein